MNKKSLLLYGLLGSLLLPVLPVQAQQGPKFGDLIVSGYSMKPAYRAVFTVDPANQKVQTLHMHTQGSLLREVNQWVGMMDDNRDLALLTYAQQADEGLLYRISPGGMSTLLGRIKAPQMNDATGAVWDPEGRLLIASGRSVYRYDPLTPGPVTPVFHFPASPTAQPLFQGVAVAPGPTGHFNVNYYLLNALPFTGTPNLAPPYLYRFDPTTRTFTSLVVNPALRTATSLSYQHGTPKPSRKRFLLTRGAAGSGPGDLLTVDFRSGAISTLLTPIPVILPSAHKATQRNTAWVVGSTPSPTPYSQAVEIDLTSGRIVKTVRIQAPPAFQATGIEEYGTNMLQTRGRAFLCDAPLTLDLQTQDPSLAGKKYLLALSFETSPPIQLTVGGSPVNLNLAADPLLWTSLFSPSVIGLSSSAGTLDASGNASATLSLPASIPKTNGLTLYAAWIVYEGSTIYRVSEAELFVLP